MTCVLHLHPLSSILYCISSHHSTAPPAVKALAQDLYQLSSVLNPLIYPISSILYPLPTYHSATPPTAVANPKSSIPHPLSSYHWQHRRQPQQLLMTCLSSILYPQTYILYPILVSLNSTAIRRHWQQTCRTIHLSTHPPIHPSIHPLTLHTCLPRDPAAWRPRCTRRGRALPSQHERPRQGQEGTLARQCATDGLCGLTRQRCGRNFQLVDVQVI